jgi:diacylglycerol kinase (ATP)
LPALCASRFSGAPDVHGEVPELITSWHAAKRVAFNLGYAKSASKEWCVVEGVGGGLIPAGIAAAEQFLDGAEVERPSTAVAAAVRLFHHVLAHLVPVRRTLVIDGKCVSDDFLMFEVLNIRSVGPNLVLVPDASPLTDTSM